MDGRSVKTYPILETSICPKWYQFRLKRIVREGDRNNLKKAMDVLALIAEGNDVEIRYLPDLGEGRRLLCRIRGPRK